MEETINLIPKSWTAYICLYPYRRYMYWMAGLICCCAIGLFLGALYSYYGYQQAVSSYTSAMTDEDGKQIDKAMQTSQQVRKQLLSTDTSQLPTKSSVVMILAATPLTINLQSLIFSQTGFEIKGEAWVPKDFETYVQRLRLMMRGVTINGKREQPAKGKVATDRDPFVFTLQGVYANSSTDSISHGMEDGTTKNTRHRHSE